MRARAHRDAADGHARDRVDRRANAPERPHVVVVGEGDPDDARLEPLRGHRISRCAAGELSRLLPDADVLFVWSFATPELRSHWSSAEKLSWIHTATAGIDNVLFPGLAASSVTLTSSRGVFDVPIAEYVIGLIIALAKDFPATLAAQRERRWEHRETDRVGGRHLVLVGAGPIAQAVARTARCLGMSVEAVARSARPHDPVLGPVHAAAELGAVLERADDVVIAAPLTEGPRGLVGRDALLHLRAGTHLVNVGRGAVLDHEALLEALDDGRVTGAALDVFETEPLPERSALWDDRRVVVSPHTGGGGRRGADAAPPPVPREPLRGVVGESLS